MLLTIFGPIYYGPPKYGYCWNAVSTTTVTTATSTSTNQSTVGRVGRLMKQARSSYCIYCKSLVRQYEDVV